MPLMSAGLSTESDADQHCLYVGQDNRLDVDGRCRWRRRLPDSGAYHDADGRVLAEVGPDPLADAEGLTGVECEPADGDPVGSPLDSVGPKGTPEGVGPQRFYSQRLNTASPKKKLRVSNSG